LNTKLDNFMQKVVHLSESDKKD